MPEIELLMHIHFYRDDSHLISLSAFSLMFLTVNLVPVINQHLLTL